MADAYSLHEARLIQTRSLVSNANALYLQVPGVPVGKIWTILSGSYFPGVAETRTVFWGINSKSNEFPLTTPINISLDPVIPLPPVNEGMEIKLYPAESIFVRRDVATLGSAMYLAIRFIESDLPYYGYEEPLRKVMTSTRKHGSVYRSTGGISPGGGAGGGEGAGEPPGGGGGGEPQPV